MPLSWVPVTEAKLSGARLATYLKRMFDERAGARPRSADEPDPIATASIRVRRFAGPSAYVERMDPLRIAHLTDLHVGRITPISVHRAAARLTNAERPDLVVLTGDFVCHSLAYLDALEEIVRSFEAPVIGVLGNHDHWSGGAEVARALERAGALVLSNRNTVVHVRGQALQIVGLDDAYTGHARRDEAVKGLQVDVPTLGLSHIAEEADGLWPFGVPLVLSGHTHAGQLTFGRVHQAAFSRLTGHRYVHGLYGCRKGEAAAGAVYVGAGLGSSVVPFRAGDRGQREVAFFELGCAPGSFEEHHAEQPPHPGRMPSARAKARRAKASTAGRERRGP